MKKKGFTLVELLAVIVVLAIIALIATPTILGVIEKARKGADKASALNYIDAVEKYMVLSELDSEKYPIKLEAGETYQVSDIEYKEIGFIDYLIESVKAEDNSNIVINDLINIKGEYPTSGTVTIGKNNTVAEAEFELKNYYIYCTEDCVAVGKVFNNDSLVNITIGTEERKLAIGNTLQLSTTVDSKGLTITYKSNNTNIATVSSTGVVTGISEGTVTITVIAGRNSKKIQLEIIKPICKRATKLHEETCTQTSKTQFCSGVGYTSSGAKKTTKIEYGNLGVKGTLNPGDAYDCDVDGDGIYNPETERFYYVSEYYNTFTKQFEDNKMVLIYYNNVVDGVANKNYTNIYELGYYSDGTYKINENWHGPVTTLNHLPTMDSWKNVQLFNNGERQLLNNLGGTSTTVSNTDSTKIEYENPFVYTNSAARLLTLKELDKACGISLEPGTVGDLDNCIFLMENTSFSTPASSSNLLTYGYWLENPSSNISRTAYFIYFNNRYYSYIGTSNGSSASGIRPVIELYKSTIEN